MKSLFYQIYFLFKLNLLLKPACHLLHILKGVGCLFIVEDELPFLFLAHNLIFIIRARFRGWLLIQVLTLVGTGVSNAIVSKLFMMDSYDFSEEVKVFIENNKKIN